MKDLLLLEQNLNNGIWRFFKGFGHISFYLSKKIDRFLKVLVADIEE